MIEITETENLDMELVKRKSNADGFLGIFALDDYGSGYNSELNLLDLKPKFLKIDISIVRDIGKDASKQRMVSNVLIYAHEQDMLIIAEGLETAEELKKTLEIGVDLVQVYYLARPAKVPESISEEALAVIEYSAGELQADNA